MDDGHKVPELHDGMGCFMAPKGGYILVRNHEIREIDQSVDPEMAYDPRCRGGTTTVHLDQDLNVDYQYLSLTGTLRNCSGGVMPWGSWLSCEEQFLTRGEYRHGYVFEVNHRHANTEPEPLVDLGRFEHEACIWEPIYGHVYMTEDKGDGNLYRFIPNRAQDLSAGGVLQALGLNGKANPTQMQCLWITISDPDPSVDTLRFEAQSKGAARFVRPEGLWIDQGGIYFSATAGGKHGAGEIYRYIVTGRDKGLLERIHESDGSSIVQPDALTRAPNGDLLICTDSAESTQSIVGMKPNGSTYVFAEGKYCGWAGITCSPDQKVLFVNQQYLGRTLAITGDWSQLS